MIKKYFILLESDVFRLESKVNEYIEKGWQPLGGFVIRKGSLSGYDYIQPLVRYED